MIRLSWISLGLALACVLATPGQAHCRTPRPKRATWPEYSPASPTASNDERQASWQTLHVRGFDDAGLAEVGAARLKGHQQKRYYQDADATEALARLEESLAAKGRSLAWMAVAPGVFAVVGLGVGGYLGNVRPTTEKGGIPGLIDNTDLERFGNTVEGGVIGSVATGLLGFGIGLGIGAGDRAQAATLRAQAAESFNQKLLKDVNLRALPRPGGGTLELQKQF